MNAKTPSAFEKYIELGFLWIRTHQERFWTVVGVTILTILFGFFAIQQHQRKEDDAWTQLGAPQGSMMQNQFAEAKKSLDDWQNRFGSSNAATYAKFLRADLLSKTTDHAAAAQLYDELARTGQPATLVQPLALSAQITEEEMAGKPAQARASAQRFLERYPDHFFAASAFLAQARLAEQSGDKAEAARLYERFVILYSQSPWTGFVREHLKTLAPAPTSLPISK